MLINALTAVTEQSVNVHFKTMQAGTEIQEFPFLEVFCGWMGLGTKPGIMEGVFAHSREWNKYFGCLQTKLFCGSMMLPPPVLRVIQPLYKGSCWFCERSRSLILPPKPASQFLLGSTPTQTLPGFLERVFLHMRFYNREIFKREQSWGLAPKLQLRKSCHPRGIDPRNDPKSISNCQGSKSNVFARTGG